MQHPVDYMLKLRVEPYKLVDDITHEPKKSSAVFRMFESGFKSPMSKDDYVEVVKQLFLALCDDEVTVAAIERLPQPLDSAPDYLSYDVVAKIGSDRLRKIAATQEGHVRSWFNQEADILEIRD
jgi:hypothetical protein